MSKLLKPLLEQMTANKDIKKYGSENMMGIIDIGYVPPTLKDEQEISGEIVDSVSYIIGSFVKCYSRDYRKSGLNEHTFHAHFNEDYQGALLITLNNFIRTGCAYDGPGVTLCTTGKNVEEVLEHILPETNINQLFFYWYIWAETDTLYGTMNVMPVGNVIQKALVGKVDWSQYVESQRSR